MLRGGIVGAYNVKEATVVELSNHEEEETKDEESFDPIVQTPKNSNDEGNDDASLGLNISSEEGQDVEDNEDELYRDININLEGRDVQMTDFRTTQEFEDTHVTLTPVNPDGQQQSSSVSSQFVTSMLNPSPDAGIDYLFQTTTQMNVPTSTTVASFTLYAPTIPPPSIPTNYKGVSQGAIKVQVSKILPKIEKTVNEQLEAKVVTRSSNSSAVAADLSEMELKNILIEKMERNKSIHRFDDQRNLYKALVEAYESDKIILDTYRDTVTLKRRCDDANKDEEPFAGLDRRSKRRREGKEPKSTSALKEKVTKTTGKSTQGSKSQQKTTSESALAEEPMQTTQDLEKPSHQEFETGATDDQHIAKTDDELTEKQLKQVESDDQAIQTIPFGLPKDIYDAVDSCKTAHEIWLRIQQMMKGSDIGIQEKKVKLFSEWERFTYTDRESIESYYHHFSKLMNDFKRNKHFP
nr:ribonuclease H-like domain-containing protein [Tanacetum cinerariifolium]